MSNRTRSRGEWIAALSIGLPLAYVLSFGPAMWLMGCLLKAGLINEGGQVVFGVLYFPLWWIGERSPVIEAVLRWYAALLNPAG